MAQASILSQNIPLTDIGIADLIAALLVVVIGYLISGVLSRMFNDGLSKTALPEMVAEFLTHFLSALLYVAILLIALSTLNFDISSVVVGLSAVIGLILGFGMQDTLTNIASGVWIATLRPIDKDEYVRINGISGTVSTVGIMATELLTPDNQLVTIPNKLVWNEPIINATRMPIRRVSVDVGISYGTDLETAIQLALDLMNKHPLILDDPTPAVVTTELAESSVNLQIRAWTDTADFWTAKFNLTNGILNVYKENGIEIPFPQLDVHMDRS
ncbi:MAG: mechanosensitive ion channel family protein [Euryarchaeota archaeon]|nr:mechanosensitive ion channel family protein [Euryarchaeota archaeon]